MAAKSSREVSSNSVSDELGRLYEFHFALLQSRSVKSALSAKSPRRLIELVFGRVEITGRQVSFFTSVPV